MSCRVSPGLASVYWSPFDSVANPSDRFANRIGNARSAEDNSSFPSLSPYSDEWNFGLRMSHAQLCWSGFSSLCSMGRATRSAGKSPQRLICLMERIIWNGNRSPVPKLEFLQRWRHVSSVLGFFEDAERKDEHRIVRGHQAQTVIAALVTTFSHRCRGRLLYSGCLAVCAKQSACDRTGSKTQRRQAGTDKHLRTTQYLFRCKTANWLPSSCHT